MSVFHPPSPFASQALIPSLEKYRELHKKSIEDPASFWSEMSNEFTWKNPPTKSFFSYNFNVSKGPISIKWMEGAKTNICYNALDRIVNEKKQGDRIAFYWEGNDPDDSKSITYSDLLKDVCRFANVLKSKGIKKGDVVTIYMPMIIELPVAMLACARIGAIHSLVFGGFSSDSLTQRIMDAQSKFIITADATWRGTKLVDLKEVVQEAMEKSKSKGNEVKLCIVVKHLGATDATKDSPSIVGKRPYPDLKISWNDGVDVWWHDVMKSASDACDPEWMDAEDYLFMLYTSGSTGKPKGVMHTTGGYMMYTYATFKYVFDFHSDDVYWCTADIGWITGHSYVAYGPLLNGATGVIFEGLPTHPEPDRYWAIIDKYKVTKFYTAPTAIRALMKFSNDNVTKHGLKTLKVLGTVGEPINSEAWLWYHKLVGHSNCPIVDTYWQTETGGHVITPLPGAISAKPGSATFPFFGVVPAILKEDGSEIEGPGEGYLVFKQPWPGIMRTVYGDHKRFEDTYFARFPGYYNTGDGARRDEDGYYWITGRMDDQLNVSGHLMSTSEVESALLLHPGLAEAAVVACPHPVKGQCLYCFIVMKDGHEYSPKVVQELRVKVRETIGAFASPDYVQYAPGLPKTRSGKIIRRILRKIAVGDRDFGDTSTLTDQAVVEQLFELRDKSVSSG